ncbi:SGNH/GDSL hydrolase family protein [Desertivirga brevis]|uniref:SGNH/GDSL hydrolase family protein n=1 Tax=Desertivirga brevis TaxID=2810310 RepID=UPI001A9745FD|nr:SGNH/GDSL hydrolase family protein [Pedobacter sp. SYSU D00873]
MKVPGRRSFIQKASMGTLMALSIPQLILTAFAEDDAKNKKIPLAKNEVILFQGDSITDAGRSKENSKINDPRALGNGYAYLATADLLNDNPQKQLKIYNRGISGNKVYQLSERWDNDTLKLEPTVLSILIGVNDFWHMKKHGYAGTIETYKKDYISLLDKTKQKFPELKLIIGEPFAIIGSAVDASWFPAFEEYQEAAREIANTYNAAFIPYQRIFDQALKLAPGEYWAPDGVHPSIAGARLMASAWLETIKG